MDMTGRIIPPEKMGETPEKAQWLSGEGGGAWFHIQKEENSYHITRYTPAGILDCDRLFQLKNQETFNDQEVFEMQHISHCAIVRVKQNGNLVVFKYIEK